MVDGTPLAESRWLSARSSRYRPHSLVTSHENSRAGRIAPPASSRSTNASCAPFYAMPKWPAICTGQNLGPIVSHRQLDMLARKMCEADGVNPNETFLCGGCDEPQSKPAQSSRLRREQPPSHLDTSCAAARTDYAKWATKRIRSTMPFITFLASPSHALSWPTDSDQNTSRFSRNVLHG
jgi:hypothetical protein